MASTYLDRLEGIETSVAVKAPVRVATTANITLSGEQTVDGVALAGGDRVLVKDQASAIDNGIWNVSTGSWSRAEDFNGVRDAVPGTRVYVVSGAANGNTEWSVTTDDPQIGAAAVAFTMLASMGGLHFGSVTDLLASTSLMAATGEVVYAGGALFTVAASGASDHHATTAGGVKLYVSPGNLLITPRMFGAKGDGVTDDRAAFQRMWDFAGQRECVIPAGTWAFPTPAGYDVYLLAGDDWMAGDNPGPIDGVLDAPDARILQYSYDLPGITAAGQPLGGPGPAAGVSPGLNFAKGMLAKTPANRGIIIVAAAGTVAGTMSAWQSGGAAYTAAVTGINAALAHGGGTNRFIGVAWAGGYADATGATTEAQAGGYLNSLMTGLRAGIAGAAKAKLVVARFITEFSGSGGAVDLALAHIHKWTIRATFIPGLTGYQLASHRTTAAGSRLLGSNLAAAMLGNLPYDFGDQFFAVSGFRHRAWVTDGAVFTPTRPQGVILRFDRANEATLTSVRGMNSLVELADELRARDTKGQWPGNVMAVSDHAFSREWGATAPDSPQTTLHAFSIGLPEGNGNVGGSAACTIGLGPQNLWGHVSVLSNSRGLDYPEGNPTAVLGHEIDIQMAAGTGAQNGAGLLVNCFDDPVNFAAVAVAGSAGGTFATGLWLGNISGRGIWLGSTFAGVVGYDSQAATFSDAAIHLGAGATHGIKLSGGGSDAVLYKNSVSGAMVLDNQARLVLTNASAEGNEILALARASDGQEGLRAYLAAGTVANTADAALRMRANSTTGRSINAGGTINASGADYAEYETKHADCGHIAKGAIVGFDADGLLTDRFDLAISFAVKSTSPNLVGGDTWGGDAAEPVEPAYEEPVHLRAHGLGERPMVNTRTSDAADVAARAADWDAAHAAWQAARDAHLADWRAAVLVPHEAALAARRAAAEAARQRVDRIAYCGKVPVNVTGAKPGDWIVPERAGDGRIGARFVDDDAVTFAEYRLSVGRVRRILPDGRAEITVKPI
jgi:hypothetical protein